MPVHPTAVIQVDPDYTPPVCPYRRLSEPFRASTFSIHLLHEEAEVLLAHGIQADLGKESLPHLSIREKDARVRSVGRQDLLPKLLVRECIGPRSPQNVLDCLLLAIL